MPTKLFRSKFDRHTAELLLIGLLFVLLIFGDLAVFAHPGAATYFCAGTEKTR